MRIIDLFSGAGGLSFGFYYELQDGEFVRRSNIEFVFANEFDAHAVNAFKSNYGDNIPMIEGDIRNITDDKIDELIKGKSIDVVIGGPPCQSFSTVGQRQYDDKAQLYKEYLRILEKVKPKMFLFENVKGLLSMKEIFYERDEEGNIVYEEIEKHRGEHVFKRKKPKIERYGELVIEKIKKIFNDIGYDVSVETKCATEFGVPQNRERVFIIGKRTDLNIEWHYPQGNNTAVLSVSDAISDLPPVGEGKEVSKYNLEPTNDYQRLMRKGSDCITEHYCGEYGEKIRTVIENVKQGQGKDDFNALIDKGLIDRKYYLTSGYKNTYGRLVANQPCTTITNNLATPSGLRCIHYEQNRALTPREGARIQSFPDWYKFDGSRTDVARQVGNAVPPLMAIAFANSIIEALAVK